ISGPEMLPALQNLSAAHAANQAGRGDAGVVAAQDAKRNFAQSASLSGAIWAQFEEVVALRIRLRSEECLPLAAPLIDRLENRSYPWLRAQVRIEYADCAIRT